MVLADRISPRNETAGPSGSAVFFVFDTQRNGVIRYLIHQAFIKLAPSYHQATITKPSVILLLSLVRIEG